MLYRIIIALIFVFSLFAVTAPAQSGRSRNLPSPTDRAKTPNKESSENTDAIEPADATPETIEGDTLRVDTSLVTLPVSVMDRYGRYVPDLRRQDFHVFDQGVEQKLAYFATVDQPFTVALVIDTSNSTHFKLEDIQNAAISFVNQLQPQDRVMVITFDESIKVLSEATSDREALRRAILKTRTGGGTRLYDAVEMVIRKKLSAASGRKAIVLFTDGVDTTSHSASYSSTIRQAQESDGAIFTVAYDTSREFGNMGQGLPLPGGNIGIGIPGWPGGNGGRGGYPGSGRASSPEYRRADQYLHELADVSAGRYYRGDSIADVSSAFAQIADELRRQYSLGYYPRPVGTPGQVRQIKVRVTQPDLVVKTRESYVYARQPAAKSSDGQPLTGKN